MLKPAIVKHRDIRGRRIVGYSATLGIGRSIGRLLQSARCDTPAAAVEDLEYKIRQSLDRLDIGGFHSKWNGQIYAVLPTFDGWQYTFWVTTDYNVTAGAYSTRECAIERCLFHMAQNAWTADTDDPIFLASLPPSLRSELAGWIGFQRAYIRERTAGTPETECHARACERPERIEVPA